MVEDVVTVVSFGICGTESDLKTELMMSEVRGGSSGKTVLYQIR